MVSGYETVIRVLKVGLKSNDGLLSHILDLLHEITHILPLAHQVFNDRCEQLLRALVIVLKCLAGRLEPLRILI